MGAIPNYVHEHLFVPYIAIGQELLNDEHSDVFGSLKMLQINQQDSIDRFIFYTNLKMIHGQYMKHFVLERINVMNIKELEIKIVNNEQQLKDAYKSKQYL